MFTQERHQQSPSRRAQRMREAGHSGSSFAGTFPGNTRELPEGGRHELTDGMEHNLDSKAMKAAKFINDAEKVANTGEFQLPVPQKPGQENDMNGTA